MNRQITVKAYKRRFRKPLRTARGAWTVREGFLLRVEQDGEVGYGEVAPLPEFGSETVAAADAFLRILAKEPERDVPDTLPCCAFALSAALQGGCGARGYSVSGLLPAGLDGLAMAGQKAAAGYRSLKWKIGVEPIAAELDCAQRLLAGLAPGCRIRLDANGGLIRGEMEQWLDFLAGHAENVDYLEQPMACGEEATMAESSAAFGVAIALDESLNGPEGSAWLKPGVWNGPLVIKAALMGDVNELLERLRAIAGQVVLSSVFETGVGLENSLRLLDRVAVVERPIGFDTVDAFDDGLNPIISKPSICEALRRSYAPEKLWNLI